MSVIQKLNRLGHLAGAKPWVIEPELEVLMGSAAYGVSGNSSDIDLYSVCIPPKEILFPHLRGFVPGFGPKPEEWENWQRHHIKTEEGSNNEKEYDVTSYSIVSFFRLAAENNPNMIDALFVPDRCVSFMTDIGRVMRDNRRMFLHKGAYPKFRGYAYTQMRQIREKKPVGKRVELVEKFGYDTKFAYHCIRLADECRQILMTGNLDIEQNREELKAIRRGEWSMEHLEDEMKRRLVNLDELFLTSTLAQEPDWKALNNVLLVCLEIKFGSLSAAAVADENELDLQKYRDIVKIVQR